MIFSTALCLTGSLYVIKLFPFLSENNFYHPIRTDADITVAHGMILPIQEKRLPQHGLDWVDSQDSIEARNYAAQKTRLIG